MSVSKAIFDCLDNLGIAYECLEHDPVHSIEDCAPIAEALCATIPKNCFLTTRNKKTVCLYLVEPHKQFNASAVSAAAGTSRLCFGSEALLMEMLRTKPGSVSPLGLIFDEENRIRLLIDRELRDISRVVFHPCENTISVSMAMDDFLNVFLPAVGHTPTFV